MDTAEDGFEIVALFPPTWKEEFYSLLLDIKLEAKEGNQAIMALLSALEAQIASNSTLLNQYIADVNTTLTALRNGQTIPDADLATLQAQGEAIQAADTALTTNASTPAPVAVPPAPASTETTPPATAS